MRVGMHSAEFGSISIATSVTPGGLAAQISLDHGELGRALAAHLPGMEEKLGSTLGLSAKVEIRDTGAQGQGSADPGGRDTASSGGLFQGGAGYNRTSYGGVASPRQAAEMPGGAALAGIPAEIMVPAGSGQRLSVRA